MKGFQQLVGLKKNTGRGSKELGCAWGPIKIRPLGFNGILQL